MFEGEPPYADQTSTRVRTRHSCAHARYWPRLTRRKQLRSWSGRQAEFLIAAKGRPPFRQPQSMSPEFRDFIERCTVFDPALRPAAADLLNARHPPTPAMTM